MSLSNLGKLLLVCLLPVISLAQSTQTGISGSGKIRTTFDSTLQSFGAVELWDPRGGFIGGGAGVGTNIVQWKGIQGSGHMLFNYTTNFPFYLSTITTNNFPAFSLGMTTTNIFRCDTIAQVLNTSRGFTISYLECAENTGVAMNPIGMGWGSASNANASIIRTAPHTATLTTHGLGVAFNTNQALVNVNTTGGPNTTNIWTWHTVTFSNGVVMSMQNLQGGQTTIANPGTITLDSFCVGGRMGTNSTFTGKWPGFMGPICVLTNANYDGAATNLVRYLNTNYANGYFKVFN